MVKTQLRKLQIRQVLMSIIVLLIFGVLFYVLYYPDTVILGLNNEQIEKISFVLLPLYVLFSAINWRCPSCNKNIGRLINPKYCTKCGVELR